MIKLMETAKEIANTIISRGPLGVRATKEAMIRGYSMTLEEGLDLERQLATQIRTTEDFMEGARAFKKSVHRNTRPSRKGDRPNNFY